MTAFSSRFVGQPIAVAPNTEVVTHDKWVLVDQLVVAAEDFGLTHRTIAVLKAMLTFIPERDLPARLDQSIVFASNNTLATRLGGMPESTLRRHLSALVKAGVILRHDSPNRKRYAKRIRGNIALAFGFDMGPLALLADEITAYAQARILRAQERSTLHSAILVARQRLCETLQNEGIDPESIHVYSPILARTRLLLRRKDNNEELMELLGQLKAVRITVETSGNNSQNERHQHNIKKINSDSDCSMLSADNQATSVQISAFQEYRKMFPEGAQNWQALSHQASQLVPMMAIDIPVYEEAKRYMGMQIAPIVVLCILEAFDTIQNPGGFLRHLTKQARVGAFDLNQLIERSLRQDM